MGSPGRQPAAVAKTGCRRRMAGRFASSHRRPLRHRRRIPRTGPGRALARRLRLRRRGAFRHLPQERRTLHLSPVGGGPHSRQRPLRLHHAAGGLAARCHRRHPLQQGAAQRPLRTGGRRSGGRRQQADPDSVQLQTGSAGRKLPQDVPGHGQGSAGDHDQAGRPPAQHAHSRRHAPGIAPPHCPRNAGNLRAHRRPVGYEPPASGVGKPRLQPPAPAALPRVAGSGA